MQDDRLKSFEGGAGHQIFRQIFGDDLQFVHPAGFLSGNGTDSNPAEEDLGRDLAYQLFQGAIEFLKRFDTQKQNQPAG